VRVALASLALAAAFAAAGCGTVGRSTSGDVSHGKTLFNKQCASCHTLADAGSKGAIGPNLDDAFAKGRDQGFKSSTIQDVVRGQIAYAEGVMPKDLVKGDDANDVAAYVAACAGTTCTVNAAAATAPSPSGGSKTAGGADAGKQVFASAGCGTCHTLKDAGSHGNVGPNLDQTKPTLSRALDRVTNGKAPMPSFKGTLTSAQIKAVATYVSTVTHK
jgi:cbb3-type cytochrome c oxidase subunit III